MKGKEFSFHRSLMFLLIMMVAGQTFLQAQLYCTKENQELCESHLKALAEEELDDHSMGELAINVGHRFLGTPYVAKTLEIEGDEQLVVELGGLDCTTFLENVVVFSRLAKSGNLDFESFRKELEFVRYRNGEMGEYPSRLHYFSDWIYHNASRGIICDITGEIGGKAYDKDINFMSTHTSSYRQLASDAYVKAIQQAEYEISKRDYHFIPKGELASLEDKIQSGDLIAITTSLKGLDIVHVGFAIRKNGRIHLFHASTGSNKVEISEKPLADYLAGNKIQSGVMVCRLLDPS